MVIPKKAATKLRPFVLHAACLQLLQAFDSFKVHISILVWGRRTGLQCGALQHCTLQPAAFYSCLLPDCPHSSSFWLLFAFYWFRHFFSNITAFFSGLPPVISLFKLFLEDIFSAVKVVPKFILQAGFEDCVGCMYPICHLEDSGQVPLCSYKKEL